MATSLLSSSLPRSRSFAIAWVSFFLLLAVVLYLELGDIVNPSFDGGVSEVCDTQIDAKDDNEDVMGVASKYFNESEPMVLEYANLINSYLAPWLPIKGGQSDPNTKFGMIRAETFRHVSRLWLFMACCGHVKIIKGVMYYRYGGFYPVWYRLLRFMQSLKMIQDALDKYHLENITVEFFINTCDHPLSFYSSHWPGRGGFPLFSTGATADTMDVLIPDPLDLTPSYTFDLSLQSPWELKSSRAVFRGATTNFDLKAGTWGASPRVRLHRLSDVFPDLLDAKLSRWSHIQLDAQQEMEQEGVKLAEYMNFTEYNGYKYQVVVDGGGGSCRTCGVLRSNQLTVRQIPAVMQFYEPLLEDSVHILQVKRTFTDLPVKLQWAQKNDKEVIKMVQKANAIAQHVCTWEGRTLYWGILLVKYAEAMHDPNRIERPTNFCSGKPILESPDLPTPLVSCEGTEKEVDSKQYPCTYYCIKKPMNESKFVWLTNDTLAGVQRVGPGAELFENVVK